MKLTVNQLEVTLHTKAGNDIVLKDTRRSNIASMVLDELQRRSRLIWLDAETFIASRSIMWAKVVMSQRPQYFPDPCPDGDDPCAGIEPPTISGVSSEPLTVSEGEEFDPLDGITAVDGSGEPLEVTVTLE